MSACIPGRFTGQGQESLARLPGEDDFGDSPAETVFELKLTAERSGEV
jgi:hypothetical protein